MSEVEIDAQIKAHDEAVAYHQTRKTELLKDKEDLQRAKEAESSNFTQILPLDPPVPRDNTLITRFLEPKILPPHKERHGLAWEYQIKDNLVTGIVILSNTTEDYNKEIRNAVAWACRKYQEKQKEAAKT